MLAKMIDKIVSLKETKTFEIGGQTYTDGHLTRIPPHVDRPEAISVSGLDGVCKLIRTELEKVDTTIMVQAKSYLDLLGRMTDEKSVSTNDNGVTQTVEARQGVALNALVEVKPPAALPHFPRGGAARERVPAARAPRGGHRLFRGRRRDLEARGQEEHRRLLQHQPRRPDRGRKGRHHAVRTPAGRAAARSALQKGASTWNA